jgi:hypothetical protein
MKITTKSLIFFFAMLALSASDISAQASVSGFVRTMTGVPISGAQVRLVALNVTAVTDDSGFYDFTKTLVLPPSIDNNGISSFLLTGKRNELIITLFRNEKVAVSIFDMSGKLFRRFPDMFLAAGRYAFDIGNSGRSNMIFLARVNAGEKTRSITFAYCQGEITGISEAVQRQSGYGGLDKSGAIKASDSIIVTHPKYWGGLDCINTRKISATSGMQNFRMFSNDTSATGWYASKMNFVFTPTATGVSYYQQKVPDYEFEERQTQREIEQCFWRLPSEVPSAKRYPTYLVDINGDWNSTSDVAQTGGNHLQFTPQYINGKPWWEILGVQHHEMCHSYQPWYDMSGVSGFGESMPDCIRCLTGFFYWPSGTKCSGGINQAYQPGAKYWYFIELKHPGFIYGLYKLTSSTSIATAVQQITGESLDTLCKQCEAKGMPYTLGRGSF